MAIFWLANPRLTLREASNRSRPQGKPTTRFNIRLSVFHPLTAKRLTGLAGNPHPALFTLGEGLAEFGLMNDQAGRGGSQTRTLQSHVPWVVGGEANPRMPCGAEPTSVPGLSPEESC